MASFLEKYETEQTSVKKQIEQLQNKISNVEETQKDTSAWLELIQCYTDIKTLDRTILSELVE